MSCRHLFFLSVLAFGLACGPLMIERDGHRVFNPAYLTALEYRRDAWQMPDEVLAALALPPDAVVADVGAGGGFFSEYFSRHLDRGHVYATDVQDEMIERLEKRVRHEHLDNVSVVRGSFDDPGLPEGCCDLVFFSSVYKEIDGRPSYLRRVSRLLRPGGRVAILEFRPDAKGTGPPIADRLSTTAIEAELESAGFALIEQYDFLPRQSFQIFAPRDERAGREAPPPIP